MKGVSLMRSNQVKKNNIKFGVGLMSGTSLDGVDAVLVEIEGFGPETKLKVIDFTSLDMPDDIRVKILKACYPDTSNVALISSLNVELGEVWSKAVRKLLEQAQFDGELDFIASHGQTIYHMPLAQADYVRSTFQIGDPSRLAYDFNTNVVFNFRMMDMIAGGDGAPLVPYSEYILYRRSDVGVLLQNIGGIGNVTVLPLNANLEDVWAFDTGPGNMMINAATQYYYNETYDRDGLYANQGSIIQQLLEKLLGMPYLKQLPPKSTGREMFGEDVVKEICEQYPNQANDVIATLTLYTAHTIANAYRDFIFEKHNISEVIVGGGGAYNQFLMSKLKELLPEVKVITQEELGFSSDAKEAIAFAILGNETLNGMYGNVPSATGAKHSVVLGQISPKPRR